MTRAAGAARAARRPAAAKCNKRPCGLKPTADKRDAERKMQRERGEVSRRAARYPQRRSEVTAERRRHAIWRTSSTRRRCAVPQCSRCSRQCRCRRRHERRCRCSRTQTSPRSGSRHGSGEATSAARGAGDAVMPCARDASRLSTLRPDAMFTRVRKPRGRPQPCQPG